MGRYYVHEVAGGGNMNVDLLWTNTAGRMWISLLLSHVGLSRKISLLLGYVSLRIWAKDSAHHDVKAGHTASTARESDGLLELGLLASFYPVQHPSPRNGAAHLT